MRHLLRFWLALPILLLAAACSGNPDGSAGTNPGAPFVEVYYPSG